MVAARGWFWHDAELDTVSENAHEPPPDDRDSPNGAYNLSVEATQVNQAFQHQTIPTAAASASTSTEAPCVRLPRASPFAKEGERLIPHGYRYKRFRIGDFVVVVRCEVDALLKRVRASRPQLHNPPFLFPFSPPYALFSDDACALLVCTPHCLS